MSTEEREGAPALRRALPAFLLVLLAPLVAEVLPGATRFSSLFVLPVEMCIWGGGAVLIREAVRRGRLGWANMLALGLALSIAEECLIQQTSLAPMVLQLKGETYARAFGVNYVYFLWALAYEAVFVVILPIHLVEMIFPGRRDEPWINRTGLIAAVAFFVLGSCLAWFSWTQIARPKVFHVPAYSPPLGAMAIAVGAIAVLIFLALGPPRRALAHLSAPRKPPPAWQLGIAGAVWAALWYGLVLLGFGIAPSFPPTLAVGGGIALLAMILGTLPGWAADPRWDRGRAFATIFGTMLGSMIVSFVGFLGATSMDLYFKIVIDLVAVLLMVALGLRKAPQ